MTHLYTCSRQEHSSNITQILLNYTKIQSVTEEINKRTIMWQATLNVLLIPKVHSVYIHVGLTDLVDLIKSNLPLFDLCKSCLAWLKCILP